MPCTRINGAIVCGPRRKAKLCGCGSRMPALLLCDWKVEDRTCDAAICVCCSTSPAPDKDLCAKHADAWRAWLRSRPPRDDARPEKPEASAAA